jgi:hypothetical protein
MFSEYYCWFVSSPIIIVKCVLFVVIAYNWNVCSLKPVNDRVMAVIPSIIGTTNDIARTPIGGRPLQDIEVSTRCCVVASTFVPIAPIVSRPLHNVEVSVFGCHTASFFVPMAPIGSRPLQDREVSIFGRPRASQFVPMAPIGSGPLQDIKVSVESRIRASFFVPVAPIRSCPLQNMEMAVACRHCASHGVPRTLTSPLIIERRSHPLQQAQVSTFGGRGTDHSQPRSSLRNCNISKRPN